MNILDKIFLDHPEVKSALIIGSIGWMEILYLYREKGLTLTLLPEGVDHWPFIGEADVIIHNSNTVLNCYAIHKPVYTWHIEKCINIEDREVIDMRAWEENNAY